MIRIREHRSYTSQISSRTHQRILLKFHKCLSLSTPNEGEEEGDKEQDRENITLHVLSVCSDVCLFSSVCVCSDVCEIRSVDVQECVCVFRSVCVCVQEGVFTPDVRVVHAGLVIGQGDKGCVWGPVVNKVQQDILVMN